MMMLSALRRFALVDNNGRRAQFLDAAVDLPGHDYPPVTKLFYKNGEQQQMALSWTDDFEVDTRSRQIRLPDLYSGAPVSAEEMAKKILLFRDVLDSLVLDLQNRRATRANDLWLEKEDGRLLLRGADTGAGALLRRLSRGRYKRVNRNAICDWKYIEFLRGDPEAARSGAGYHLRITRLPPGEIASLATLLPYLHAAELIILLPDPLAADVLEALPADRQLQVFEELREERALKLLALMAPDVATDLVGRLEPEQARRCLEKLPSQARERLIELLRYPEGVVGAVMTNDVVYAPANLTVAEARQTLRERLERPDFVYFIYVVEDEDTRRLCGVLSLRNLLVAGDEEKLKDIMDPYVTTLHPLESAIEASYKVIHNGLAALPVVGTEGQLVGVLTVDAAVSQVAPPGWSAQAPRVFS